MSWFPTFLNPGSPPRAAAIAIPSLLILYFLKLRRREMAVSSTLLWKKAIQDLQVNAPFQKLRRNLLLLLQILLLLFLLLALSRPVMHYTPGAGKITVILIDRSASMAANGSDWRERRASTKPSGGRKNSSKRSTAIRRRWSSRSTTRPRHMQAFTSDVSALNGDRQDPADRPQERLKMAYQLAEAQTNFNPDQLRVAGAGRMCGSTPTAA